MHSDSIVVSLIEGCNKYDILCSERIESSLSTIWFCESNHCGANKVKGINISNCSFSLDSKQSEISVELLLLECALEVLSASTKGTKKQKLPQIKQIVV